MTPTDQGRFCNACAKEVIDFSTMTDTQVLNYFTNLTHENVCGRALPEQLDRTITRPEQPKKRLFWYWNYMVMFFMFFTKGNNANAQTCTKPATELTPVTNSDVRGEVITMGGIKRDGNRIVTGKVVDIDGNPVSFASVKIKGTRTGVSADANGAYSLKVGSNAILIISGASYKETEVPVGNQNIIFTQLEKTGDLKEGLITVVTGGISFNNVDEYYGPLDKLNRVAVLRVKDEATGKSIPDASIIIKAGYSKTVDSVIADKKGIHKIKGIKDGDEYAIKVSAEGYEPNEFTIEEYDFKDRKKEWEVLLRKQKTEAIKTNDATIISGTKEPIRLRGMISFNLTKGALYVVDGTIMPNRVEINPDDVDDYSVLDAPNAMAIFGPDGANGAVVITTRKSKVKKLDTVTVTGYGRTTGKLVCTSTSYTVRNRFTDTLKVVATKLTGAIKIYPNPVQHGEQFNIALKLKQAGFYQVQITDITGRILLQKQISANTKEITEKIIADSRWSSGAYFISIIDNKNQIVSKAGFIVK